MSVLATPNDRRRLWPLLGGGVFILSIVGVSSFISIEDAKVVAASAKQWANAHLALAVATITIAQFLSGVTAVPTKGATTLVAGALIGPPLAIAGTLSGIAAGTTILFFTTRKLLGSRVRERLGQRVVWVEEKLASRPIRSMIALRLMIALPYGPITMAAALSRVRYRDFIIGSALGDLPVIALYSVAGSRLQTLASTRDVIDPWTAAILVTAATVLLASVLLSGNRRTSQMGL